MQCLAACARGAKGEAALAQLTGSSQKQAWRQSFHTFKKYVFQARKRHINHKRYLFSKIKVFQPIFTKKGYVSIYSISSYAPLSDTGTCYKHLETGCCGNHPLGQWFSIILTLQPFTTVPYVEVTPSNKTILLLLYKFAFMNTDVNILYAVW